MLLAYRANPSFFAVAQRVGVHHQTVQRCIERALAYPRTSMHSFLLKRSMRSSSGSIVGDRLSPPRRFWNSPFTFALRA
jgi:hypothetical protein